MSKQLSLTASAREHCSNSLRKRRARRTATHDKWKSGGKRDPNTQLPAFGNQQTAWKVHTCLGTCMRRFGGKLSAEVMRKHMRTHVKACAYPTVPEREPWAIPKCAQGACGACSPRNAARSGWAHGRQPPVGTATGHVGVRSCAEGSSADTRPGPFASCRQHRADQGVQSTALAAHRRTRRGGGTTRGGEGGGLT